MAALALLFAALLPAAAHCRDDDRIVPFDEYGRQDESPLTAADFERAASMPLATLMRIDSEQAGQTYDADLLWPDAIVPYEIDSRHSAESRAVIAAGLAPLQKRADRNEYVQIVWQNIHKGMEGQLKKYPGTMTTDLNTEYDYLAVMHYGGGESIGALAGVLIALMVLGAVALCCFLCCWLCCYILGKKG